MISDVIRQVVKAYPEIVPMLKGRARWLATAKPEAYKTYEFFLSAVERMVRNVYAGILAGDFVDVMANLISGQIFDAYQRAWLDDGGFLPIPAYLEQAVQNDTLKQYDYVDNFYRDIVDARIDKTPIDPLMARAQMWANQWNASYNNALILIRAQEGGNLIWIYGDTDHCETCEMLNGTVASAAEWVESGYQPQGKMLECGGWRCQCHLDPTDQRRSRDRKTRLGIA